MLSVAGLAVTGPTRSGRSLAQLLASGRVFDFVLAVVALELLGFLAYRAFRGRSLVALDVYPNLMAAAGLLGAARLVIAGAWWGYPCLLLSLALVSHLLALRWGARRAAYGAQNPPA